MTISIKNAKKIKIEHFLSLLILNSNSFFSLNTNLVAALPFIILFKINYVIRLNGLIII